MKSMKRSVFIVPLFFLFSALSLSALTYEGIEGEMGFLWKNNDGYDTEEGDSGPDVLTFIPGVALFYTFDDQWFFWASVFLFSKTLEYLP